MAYTNFQNCTANEYKNIIYNQETQNKIKVLFNNVELEDADEYCESFEVVSRVIPNGSKIFMLENLVSQEATLVLHNIDTSIIQDQVSISIGTLVSENTYEYVPIGIYNLQEIPTTDNGKTTIKLRDNSVKLDFNYNAKPLIDEHGGTATKLQILQDICTKASITCNVSSFIGSNDLISIYDNTITGRQYVAYLAGSAGAIPIITRSGALDFKYLNNLSTIEIPIEIVEQYSNAENFKISRVVYEDAIRKYESGNETYDTLFLDSANPYISSQEQVASIYNIVNNFEINSFTTGRILGNPAIDSYDLIQITDYDGTIFKTFANNTLRYNGKMINTFASEISFERKKENVSLKSGATFKKWAKTEIDNANAQITIQAGQIDEIEQDLQNPTSIKEGEYFDLEDALDEPLIDFSLYGETQQDSTPTPSSPQPIHNVSGDNTIEICGKNLLDISDITSTTGITRTNDNITLNGRPTSTNWSITKPFILKANTTYTLSITERLTASNVNNSAFILRNGSTNIISIVFNDEDKQVQYTPTQDTIIDTIRIYGGGYTFSNFTFSVQLEKNNEATTYEAYTGNSQLISLGVENLLPNNNTTKTINGITFTKNDNGSITLSGTSNAVADYYLVGSASEYVNLGLSTGTYNLNGVINGSLSTYMLYAAVNRNGTLSYYQSINNTGLNISVQSGDTFRIFIRVLNSQTPNTTIYPQLEKGSKANSYSPYGASYIELCKIEKQDHTIIAQDYFYPSNDKWYLHKEIGKYVYNNNLKFNVGDTNTMQFLTPALNITPSLSENALAQISFCNVMQTKTSNYSGLSGTTSTYKIRVYIAKSIAPTQQDALDLFANKNLTIYYPLATPTDTEITDTNLLEQLNNLMALPLYKNITHITLTPNDLQPTMKIEYYRDTSINENFVPKEDMTKYYTKTETNAQIQINNSSIQQSVAEMQTTLDSNGNAISTISNQVQSLQTSTSQQINIINEQLENGVEKVKTTTGFTFDENGLDITKGEGFHSQITDRTLEVNSDNKELIFLGYDNEKKKTVARMDWIESEHATIGVHRTETITKNGQKRTAGFYVGGGN